MQTVPPADFFFYFTWANTQTHTPIFIKICFSRSRSQPKGNWLLGLIEATQQFLIHAQVFELCSEHYKPWRIQNADPNLSYDQIENGTNLKWEKVSDYHVITSAEIGLKKIGTTRPFIHQKVHRWFQNNSTVFDCRWHSSDGKTLLFFEFHRIQLWQLLYSLAVFSFARIDCVLVDLGQNQMILANYNCTQTMMPATVTVNTNSCRT